MNKLVNFVKKNKYIVLVVVAALLIALYMNKESFEGAGSSNHPSTAILVFFQMDGCGHCDAFKPTWDELQVPVAKKVVNAKERDTVEKYGVQGFPTIAYCPDGLEGSADSHSKHEGERSAEAINKWLASLA